MLFIDQWKQTVRLYEIQVTVTVIYSRAIFVIVTSERWNGTLANSADPDLKLHKAVSDQSLHCLFTLQEIIQVTVIYSRAIFVIVTSERWNGTLANSADPDLKLHKAVSDQSLHCLFTLQEIIQVTVIYSRAIFVIVTSETWNGTLANSADLDLKLHKAVSDQSLHCLFKLQEVNG